MAWYNRKVDYLKFHLLIDGLANANTFSSVEYKPLRIYDMQLICKVLPIFIIKTWKYVNILKLYIQFISKLLLIHLFYFLIAWNNLAHNIIMYMPLS